MNKRGQDLLDMVLATPGDPTLRLVFADWCDESGDAARAELIRVQVEHASLPSWDGKRVHLKLRERALLTEHAERLAPPAIAGVVFGSYAGGFVDNILFNTLGLLAAHSETLRRTIPFRKITLRWPRLDERVKLKPIDGLREIQIIGTMLDTSDIEWLLSSPLLSTIESLSIIGSNMEDAAVEALIKSPFLKQLRTLRLPHHSFGNKGAATLIKKAELPALRELDLSVATQVDLGSGGRHTPTFDDVTAAGISQWNVLEQLEALDLSGHEIDQRGVSALVGSKHAAGLKRLHLRSVTNDGGRRRNKQGSVFRAMDAVHRDMRLDVLDLGENVVEDSDLPVRHAALSQLKTLRLDAFGGNLRRVANSSWFTKSLRVYSSASPASPSVLGTLLESAPERLHTIELPSPNGGLYIRDFAPILQYARPTPSLLTLDLSGAEIAQRAMTQLGKFSPLFPNLVSLSFSDQWSEIDVGDFVASPFGQQLKSLHVRSPNDKLPPLPPESVRLGRAHSLDL